MDIIDFTCGLFAGWSQILVGHPFDSIKTKYQISKTSQGSFMKFVKEIYH